MIDFGGVVSVELDATLEQTSDVLSAMEVFQLAERLGDVETLVEQPAVMTHPGPLTGRTPRGSHLGQLHPALGR